MVDETEKIALEEARQEHEDWVRIRNNINTKASIFVAVNVFLAVALIQLELPNSGFIGWKLIGGSIFGSLVCSLLATTQYLGGNPGAFRSSDEIRGYYHVDEGDLVGKLIGKHTVGKKHRRYLKWASRLMRIATILLMFSLGGVALLYISQLT
jgi:hypothetical protein